jgi:hypothetical protein
MSVHAGVLPTARAIAQLALPRFAGRGGRPPRLRYALRSPSRCTHHGRGEAGVRL